MDYRAWIDSPGIDRKPLKPRQRRRLLAKLTFAATGRCQCGAGLAYLPSNKRPYPSAWDCSACVLGDAIPSGQPGAVTHDRYPFTFWEIKSETQPSAAGRSTRPVE